MQVKKFEARTMKEALEMVKIHLGPDAIILSARDNQKSFGLVGEGSVEITAAVSEETLQKKKFAESRMRSGDVESFQKTSARNQKTVIDKMVNKYVEKNKPRPAVTSRRYADIDDDAQQSEMDDFQFSEQEAQVIRKQYPATKSQQIRLPEIAAALKASLGGGQAQQAQSQATPRPMPAQQQQAAQISRAVVPVAQAAVPSAQEVQAAQNSLAQNAEVSALKNELQSLREIISRFQSMPQSMVGTHPGSDFGLPFDLSFMFERLTGSGVAPEIAAEILTKAQDSIPALKLKNRNLVDGWVARHILATTPVTGEHVPGKVHVFVGPAGSGKTNALVKMASHLVVREKKKVALITADTFKVGASDQMRIFAQILNVPFAVVRSSADWANLMRYLSTVDVVLLDMPGFSLKNAEELEVLRNLMPPSSLNPRVHFVASAVSKDADVTEAARRYSVFGFDDAIFTSLDEAAQHGTIYNFTRRFGVPLSAFGIGPRVPEDFEPATRERVLDLLFKITRGNLQNTSQI